MVVVWRDSQGGGAHMALRVSGMWGTVACGREVGTGDFCPPPPPTTPLMAMGRGPANVPCPWDRGCWVQWGAGHTPLSSPQQPWGLAGTLPCLGVWGQGTSAAGLGASL